MKVKIRDKENIRESVPIEIEISDSTGEPRVYVENLGSVGVKLLKGKYMAQFWVMEKGLYRVVIRDKKDIWNENVFVKEQSYLSFIQEFTFFLAVFSLFSLGVVLWMKRLKKIKN